MSKVPNILGSPEPAAVASTSAEVRRLEFQAVILAGGDSPMLYPMLEDRGCLALLTVANRPLIYYQLRMLEKAGFGECIVAVEEGFRKVLNDYLARAQFKIRVELFHPKLEDDQWESGFVLKQMSSILFTDFFVISGDLVSEVSIHEIADVHRTRDASATILLNENEPVDWAKSKSSPATFSYAAVQAEEIKTFYGLQQSGQHLSDYRVVMSRVSEGDEGPFLIGRNVLERNSRFVLHTNLSDAQLYVFKRWVLDLLQEQNFPSVKDDLLPYLITIQYRKDFAAKHPSLWARAKSTQSLAQSMSSAAWAAPSDEDRIRVFSYMAQYKKGGGVFIGRANSLEAFGWMSFALFDHPVSEMTPWEVFQSAPLSAPDATQQSDAASSRSGSERGPRQAKTLFGANCTVHPSANFSRCVIGDNCTIGPGVTLRNCVILAGCQIEEGSQLENCLLASGAVVRAKCSLNKCQLGPKYVVPEGSDAQNMLLTFDDNDSDDSVNGEF